jgi:hypothetical protein
MDFKAESLPARLFEHTGATTSGDQTGSRGRSAEIQTRTAAKQTYAGSSQHTSSRCVRALVILLGQFAFVVPWVWRCLPREEREHQGKHDNTSRNEGKELPERVPDAMDARTDHEHND